MIQIPLLQLSSALHRFQKSHFIGIFQIAAYRNPVGNSADFNPRRLNQTSNIPVSYTHLDVYKRQGQPVGLPLQDGRRRRFRFPGDLSDYGSLCRLSFNSR